MRSWLKPFAVPSVFERVFELFQRCGYVQRVGEKVKWTDWIAPEMRAARARTEDLISWSEAEDAEVEEMWRTIPARFHAEFFSDGPPDALSLMIIISQLWHDGKWQDTALDAGKTEITLRDAVGGKAKKLADKFRESGA